MVLLGKLASGGMGTVWLAHAEGEPEHLLAFKRMHKHLAREGQFLEMFLDEIWLTASLHHENVVELVGWGIDAEGPYFATDFVLGAPLLHLMRNGRAAGAPLHHELVAYTALQIARGLHAAHFIVDAEGKSLHIVHRDLTPGNVLVDYDGSVKITDFGVAKAATKIVNTRTGVLKGKIHYMSPDYVRGQPLDARSDLYSLGVVMYELLAGNRPFSAESEYALLHSVVHDEPPRLRDAVECDPTLATVVDRLRARDPEARLRSGAEVAEVLQEWLDERGYDLEQGRERLARYTELHCPETRAQIARIRREAARQSHIAVFQPDHSVVGLPDPTTSTTTVELVSDAAAPGPTTQPSGTSPPRTRRVQLAAPPPPDPHEHTDSTNTSAPGVERGWTTIVVVGAATAIAGAALVAVVVVIGSPQPTPAGETDATTATSVAEPTEPVEPATSAEPIEGASTTPQVAPSASSTASVTSSAGRGRPPATRKTAHAPAPRPPPPRPKRCTPLDFDYPNCKD